MGTCKPGGMCSCSLNDLMKDKTREALEQSDVTEAVVGVSVQIS